MQYNSNRSTRSFSHCRRYHSETARGTRTGEFTMNTTVQRDARNSASTTAMKKRYSCIELSLIVQANCSTVYHPRSSFAYAHAETQILSKASRRSIERFLNKSRQIHEDTHIKHSLRFAIDAPYQSRTSTCSNGPHLCSTAYTHTRT